MKLRYWKSSDAKFLVENLNDLSITKFTVIPHPYKLSDAEWFLNKCKRERKKKEGFAFAIIVDKKIVGGVSVGSVSEKNKSGQIGYWIGKNFWRKGYASEALKLLLDSCFDELGLVRVYAYVFTPNNPSVKLLEKLCFRKEGVLKKHVFEKGKWFNVFLYALVK